MENIKFFQWKNALSQIYQKKKKKTQQKTVKKKIN